jgi:hypothetical protein
MKNKQSKLADVVQATAEFERWASRHVHMVPADVKRKHQSMADEAFPFFRATFYRWAQWWPLVCPDLVHAPQVLAVGDLHVENFGTWRDIEGRLIWGVNDFDEAWPASYANDLVRVLTSCYLAIEGEHLAVSRKKACEAVEQGYRDSLAEGGSPFVLAERNRWLRVLALNKLRDPVAFWKKMRACPVYTGKLPNEVQKMLRDSFPMPGMNYELKSRVAGLGSLGHPRVLAVSTWYGSHIAREAKQLTPSAWIWARHLNTSQVLSHTLLQNAVRIRDPHVHFGLHWIVRRLAPDSSHIAMQTLPEERDEEKLLYDMGWETANIHFGTRKAIPGLKRDIARRKTHWLHKPAKAMLEVTLEDWKAWRRGWKKANRAK